MQNGGPRQPIPQYRVKQGETRAEEEMGVDEEMEGDEEVDGEYCKLAASVQYK